MNFPEKIKIGGHYIRLKIVEFEDIDNEGEYNHYTRIIRIRKDNGVPESVKAECLLHEIFEAISRTNNLGLDHTILTVLSESLFQVIRDNGLDFRYKKKSNVEFEPTETLQDLMEGKTDAVWQKKEKKEKA